MVINVKSEKSVVDRLPIDGRIIIPCRWLYEMIRYKNLVLHDTVENLMNSDVISDRVVAEIAVDIAEDVDLEFYRSHSVLYYSMKDKAWTAIRLSNQNFASNNKSYALILGGSQIGTLPQGGLYYKDTTFTEQQEYFYNKSYVAYFCSRLPMSIKSLTPKSGCSVRDAKLPVDTNGRKRPKHNGKKPVGSTHTLTRDDIMNGRDVDIVGYDTSFDSTSDFDFSK